jgi:hypothetical protein
VRQERGRRRDGPDPRLLDASSISSSSRYPGAQTGERERASVRAGSPRTRIRTRAAVRQDDDNNTQHEISLSAQCRTERPRRNGRLCLSLSRARSKGGGLNLERHSVHPHPTFFFPLRIGFALFVEWRPLCMPTAVSRCLWRCLVILARECLLKCTFRAANKSAMLPARLCNLYRTTPLSLRSQKARWTSAVSQEVLLMR